MIGRRTLLAAGTGLAAAALAPRRAAAAEFTYKFGSDLPASHPMNVRMTAAADAIRKETDGRMDIQVYPDNQLGGDPSMFAQVRSGALQFFTLSGSNVLSELVPKAAISGVGFAFKDDDAVFSAFDGPLGAYVRARIEAHGLHALDKIWNNGFRQITASARPIVTPADLKGFKIRVPVGDMWIALFRALGAAPDGISFNEVYSALQTHVVDGQENALAVIDTAKLYEVQKYCSMTNHMWDGFWFLCNKPAWDRLPSGIQDIVAKHVNAAAVLERADVVALNRGLQASLEKKGLVFNTPDPASFRAVLKTAGYYDAMRKRFGDEEWSLLEQTTGSLA